MAQGKVYRLLQKLSTSFLCVAMTAEYATIKQRATADLPPRDKLLSASCPHDHDHAPRRGQSIHCPSITIEQEKKKCEQTDRQKDKQTDSMRKYGCRLPVITRRIKICNNIFTASRLNWAFLSAGCWNTSKLHVMWTATGISTVMLVRCPAPSLKNPFLKVIFR